jgi:hypothetical protein
MHSDFLAHYASEPFLLDGPHKVGRAVVSEARRDRSATFHWRLDPTNPQMAPSVRQVFTAST